jgi:hypothetical protein
MQPLEKGARIKRCAFPRRIDTKIHMLADALGRQQTTRFQGAVYLIASMIWMR